MSDPKPYFAKDHQDGDVQGIKGIEEIFCPFSLYETSLAVVHVQGKEGKAGFPLIKQPAASNHGLRRFVIM